MRIYNTENLSTIRIYENMKWTNAFTDALVHEVCVVKVQ